VISEDGSVLRRARAVRPFANQLDFFANKIARLRTRRLPLALILARTFDRFLLWHIAFLPAV
jgi:hypothetical protein